MDAPLGPIAAWLDRHALSYAEPGGTLCYALQLKLDHSRRVAGHCVALAADMGWEEPERIAAEAAGLLHDAARFPQFSRYRTFLDAASLDHGEAGYELVREAGILAPACDGRGAAVLDAIRYHNRREVPAALPSDSLRLLHLVRDADKLDIMYVLNTAVRNGDSRRFPELSFGADVDGPPTPEVLREIRERHSASFRHLRTMADMNLVRMAWVYGFHYTAALRVLDERRLFEDLVAMLPPLAEVRELVDAARRHLAERVSRSPRASRA